MDPGTSSTRPRVNRRASQRAPLRGTVKLECRKGSLGLGPNLVRSPLDISETGVRLLLTTELKKGQEVEVLLTGGGYMRPVKRHGTVIWSLLAANGEHVVGIRFDGYLPYVELQSMTRPPRVLR
jgi:hypothetical protein